MNIPTHEEVSNVLKDSHSELAEMILSCNEKKNCWGDLLMQAQHDFDGHYIATALRRLAMAGWKENIIHTWCPLTESLWKKFIKAKNLQDEFSNMSEEEKGINAGQLDPNARTGWQMENLMNKIKSQEPKIKHLKEITKDYEQQAKVTLDDTLPPKEKVRNRADFISERRKIADFYGINRRLYIHE